MVLCITSNTRSHDKVGKGKTGAALMRTPPTIVNSNPTKTYRSSVSPINVPTNKLHKTTKKTQTRKLRKSCSLVDCAQKPGQCMHCTCDGRCGQHAAGKCGVRREGSGKNCKIPDCPKDDTCLHSTRATCCHCRNLVSSQSRGAKRARKNAAEALRTTDMTQATKRGRKTKTEPKQSSQPTAPSFYKGDNFSRPLNAFESSPATSCDHHYYGSPPTSPGLSSTATSSSQYVDDSISSLYSNEQKQMISLDMIQPLALDFLLPPATCMTEPAYSLAEYEAWSKRRHLCNLTVSVGKKNFKLHKYPMLLHCQNLKTAYEASEDSTVVYNTFPGGAEAFELVCIYAYTLTVQHWSPKNIALLYVASKFLGMEESANCLSDKSTLCVRDLAANATLEELVEFLSEVYRVLNEASLDEENTAADGVDLAIKGCARHYPYRSESMATLQTLPVPFFLRVTQEIVCAKVPLEGEDSGNNKKLLMRLLCGQTQMAQVLQSTTTITDEHQKTSMLLRILEDMLHVDSSSVKSVQLALKALEANKSLKSVDISSVLVEA